MTTSVPGLLWAFAVRIAQAVAMAKEGPKELSFGSWEQVKAEGTPPCPRYGHACAVVGNQMYIFAGASEDSGTVKYFNDMHIFHLGETTKWEAVDQQGDVPSGREGATLNTIENELFLYGGTDREDSYTCAEGLFIFKTDTRTWRKQETTGPAPKAQSFTAVLTELRLVTYGGVLNGEAQNTVHFLDTASLEWTLAATTGTPPIPRCDHACVVIGRKMYVFGGSGGNDLWFNDFHMFNLESLEWVAVEMKGIPPQPRDYGRLINLSNWYLILFGGCGSEKSYADLYFVDVTSKFLNWISVPMKESATPPVRYGHSMILYQKKVYVFAGQNDQKELNDIWVIETSVPTTGFEPTSVPRTRYSTSAPIPAPRKNVLPAPPTPVKPRDFEELRSTYTKRINEMFETLAEKFQQLDTATALLASERTAFEVEKKAHFELYERQQQELKEMLASHRQQNEEWTDKIRLENDAERRALAEERAQLEKNTAELAKEQEAFTQKSKKLDAIMRQVQGLSS